jgi:hypothetical protein
MNREFPSRRVTRPMAVHRRYLNTVLSSFVTYHRVCSKSNTTGTNSGAGTAYPFGAPPVCSTVRVAQYLVF